MATPVRTRARRWFRGSGPAAPGRGASIHGSARLDRKTKQLVKRLDAGSAGQTPAEYDDVVAIV